MSEALRALITKAEIQAKQAMTGTSQDWPVERVDKTARRNTIDEKRVCHKRNGG
jgi:hypothetical protein